MSDPSHSDRAHAEPAAGGDWRITRRLLVAVAVLITFLVLMYTFIDWRGKRAWEAYKRDFATKGGPADFASFIPPRVPDDQNFTMTPFLAPLFNFNPLAMPGQSRWLDTNGHARATMEFSRVSSAGNSSQATVLWRQERATDLADWLRSWNKLKSSGKALSGETDTNVPSLDRMALGTTVLGELSQFEPVFDELRQASERPRARFNIRYDEPDPWSILLPHLAVVKGACRALQLRASAELAAGNAQASSEDITLITRISSTIKDEPFVISHLIRLVMVDFAVQAIWEGLESRQWTDAQLQIFQTELAQLTVLRDLQRPLNGERAADNLTFELLRTQRDRERLFSGLTGAGDSQAFVFLLVPRGWTYQEQVVCNQLFDHLMVPGFDPDAQVVKPGVIDANSAALNRTMQGSPLHLVWNHLVMARLLLPALGRTFQKSALAQNGIDEAVVACALERYRLAEGHYPESLDKLQPRFAKSLPHDVCSGQALKYRVTEDGRFVLYSVGWNEQDDGGVFALRNKTSSREGTRQTAASTEVFSPHPGTLDPDQGDWVWQYPSRTP